MSPAAAEAYASPAGGARRWTVRYQAGQVPGDSTCPKLPHRFADCFVSVLAQTSTSWTMRSESVKVRIQRLWFMFASIGEQKAK